MQESVGSTDQEARIWLKSLEALEVTAEVPSEKILANEVAEALDATPEACLVGEKKKTGLPVELAFGENFVVDTMEVPNGKIIPQVIRGVALDLFPNTEKSRSNDFYYAYTYSGTRLVFAIVKSKSYLAGKLPGFLPAMLSPGKYVYRQGSQYYVLEHEDDGTVTTKVHQEAQHDCIDLEEAAKTSDTGKVEQSLYLQWSLSHNYKPVTMIMLIVFVALLAGYGATMRGYREVSARTAQLSEAAPASTSKITGLPPVGAYIKTVADSTSSLGAVIKQIKKIDKTNLAFAVEFQTENDTREFISRKGGRYEDGKVVFAFDLTGAR